MSSESVDRNSLVGIRVEHTPANKVRKSFGVGSISAVTETSIVVTFDSGEVKSFSYPICFKQFLKCLDEVSIDLKDMIECDVDGHLSKMEKEKEEFLARVQNFGKANIVEHSFWAIKRPYLDLDCSCSKVQMGNNVKAKYTVCQNSLCKNCIIQNTMSFDDVSLAYTRAGGCPESLVKENMKLQQSLRSKIDVGDVVIFTAIPYGGREQERFVYGFAVIEAVEQNESYKTLSLNPSNLFVLDYDIAVNYRFWDVMVNAKKPDVMLFGNSHAKKLSDMQAAQYVKMLSLENNYPVFTDVCSYLGISESEIKDNNGALILLDETSEIIADDDLEENIDSDEEFTTKIKPTRVVDEDAFDDIDDI